MVTTLLAALIGGYFIYEKAWRPWRNGPPGYRLVGEFEVREKNHLFSKCWVRLMPGDNFQLELEVELYERLRVGSRLRLTYAAGGGLISLVQLN